MDPRRRKIVASSDENVIASKVTFGKAAKEAKRFELSLRSYESKPLVKKGLKGKSTFPLKIQRVPAGPELPKVASLSMYTTSSNSQSFVPVDCFDDEQKYLLYIERCRALPPLFLKIKIISPKNRADLFHWMLQIQENKNFEHGTLHLAYSMVDRCLRKLTIKRDEFQLLGATCLFIATKYEEVSIPHVNDFAYLAAYSFTKRDIMVMERKVCKNVNFNMGFAYPIHFLRRYEYALQNKDVTHTLSKLFIDLFMCVYDVAHKLPSVMAQVSLYLSYFIASLSIYNNSSFFDFLSFKCIRPKEEPDFFAFARTFFFVIIKMLQFL